MIAAGVNAKALSTFMGHFSISITLDLYGHLMPGSESEAADLLDRYLIDSAEAQAAVARVGPRLPPEVASVPSEETMIRGFLR